MASTSDIKNGICLSFVDGAYREDLSDELPVGITLHQLNEKECLSFLSKFGDFSMSYKTLSILIFLNPRLL